MKTPKFPNSAPFITYLNGKKKTIFADEKGCGWYHTPFTTSFYWFLIVYIYLFVKITKIIN